MVKSRAVIITAISVLIWAQSAQASVPSAYQLIAHTTGVPSVVLYAVALQESGKTIHPKLHQPWPWTLNVAGKSYYYANQSKACTALHIALKAHNPKSIDVGIAQINWGWNPGIFASPCEALNPYKNLTAAGHLLRKHYRASGDWNIATGLYHHPAGGHIAARYQKYVAQRLETLRYITTTQK